MFRGFTESYDSNHSIELGRTTTKKIFQNQVDTVDTVESGYIIHGYIIQPLILAIFGRNRIFT